MAFRSAGVQLSVGWAWQRAHSQAHAHEQKRRGLRQRLGVLLGNGAVVVGRGGAEVRAGRRQQRAGELIVGHVAQEAVANVVVVRLHRVGPEVDGILALDAEQVAPFQRGGVGELRTRQQVVHELGPLGRVGFGQERPGLGGGGQEARRVEVDAAEELRVGAERGRGDVELAQLVQDALVDLVEGRKGGVIGLLRAGHQYASDREVPQVADHDGGVAAVQRGHGGGRDRRGDAGVGDAAAGVGAYIPGRTVGIHRRHD